MNATAPAQGSGGENPGSECAGISRATFVGLSPAASFPEQHRQRLSEVALRQSAQMEDRQHLRHLR